MKATGGAEEKAGERGDGRADVDAWATASAKLLDLAGDLSGATAGTREAASLAQTLASAFAAMPAAEVGAILIRTLGEGAQIPSRGRGESVVPASGVAGCLGSGMCDDRDEVASNDGGEGQAGSLSDACGAAVAGVVGHRGEREEGEGVAHAVADGCRELVLTCLVGRD